MTDKHYVSAEQLLDDSYRLGSLILESGFKPNFIIGVWRGGTPVGIAVQEFLDFFGVPTDHISIRTSSYAGMARQAGNVRVHGLGYVINQVGYEDSLLLVDDVYDTGLSIDAAVEHLERRCRRNLPKDIRIATAYYKPANNRTERAPDFFVHETDKWLVFPHELHGLSEREILEDKPGTAAIAEAIAKFGHPDGKRDPS